MEGGARSREGGVRARLTVPHHDPGVRPFVNRTFTRGEHETWWLARASLPALSGDPEVGPPLVG